MIDYATLTGTCVSALGTCTSGAFTNQDELTQAIRQGGLAHVATEQTGFGVRFTQAWLQR